MRNFPYLRPVLLALLLLLGTVVRVAQFGQLPPGLNLDEAASAYEAYSLAETGKDRWSDQLPAYFPHWGSGQNVLLAYLTVPVVKVFGLNLVSARLVMLLLAVLTLPLLFYCLRPLGWFTAWLATLLLAVAPWHYMLAHWALESNLVPFFMLLGCTLLSRALHTGRRRWIVPALLPFALSLYAYGTTVVVLPPLLLAMLLLHFRQVWLRRGSWLLALGLFGVVAAPFGLFFLENYVAGRNFAWTDHLFFATPLLPSSRLAQVSHASWSAILLNNWEFATSGFDDGTCYNLLPGYKPLLSATLPLALAALVVGGWQLRQQRGRYQRTLANVVLAVFATWGLASLGLFFSVGLNVNRFNHAYLPCIVLAGWVLALAISNFNPAVPRPALRVGVAAWLLFEGSLSLTTYFTSYRHGPIKQFFNEGLDEAYAALGSTWGIEQVRITENIPLSYVYALFYLRYPPAQFQREAHVEVTNGEYRVHRFGRYVFDAAELRPGQPYSYLSRLNEYASIDRQHRQIFFQNEQWEVGVITPGN